MVIHLQILLTAGTEPSALTIEWAMALLLRHPEAMRKVRAEIDTNVGTARMVEESDITNLPYLQCVVKETLRLYPVAPIIPAHEAMEDCTVSGLVHVVSLNSESDWFATQILACQSFGKSKYR